MLSKDDIDAVADAIMERNPDVSYEARRKRGEKLAWAVETSSNADGRREQKVFPRWVDAATDEPTRGSSVVSLILPPGPVSRAYISGEDMLRYEGPGDQTFQKILFSTESMYNGDKTKFHRYFRAQRELAEFLNEGRCRFLASNNKHEMLSDAQRAKIGTEKLAEDLIDALNDENNISQRRADVPKRKIFTSNKINGNHLREKDIEALDALDESGKLSQYLRGENGEKKVSLLQIAMPDGSILGPGEYSKFNPDGAIGCLSLDIYRLHCRLKKGKPEQHSVVWAATGLQLVENGTADSQGAIVFSVSDILAKRAAQPEESSVIAEASEARKKRKAQQHKPTVKKIKSLPVIDDE